MGLIQSKINPAHPRELVQTLQYYLWSFSTSISTGGLCSLFHLHSRSDTLYRTHSKGVQAAPNPWLSACAAWTGTSLAREDAACVPRTLSWKPGGPRPHPVLLGATDSHPSNRGQRTSPGLSSCHVANQYPCVCKIPCIFQKGFMPERSSDDGNTIWSV